MWRENQGRSIIDQGIHFMTPTEPHARHSKSVPCFMANGWPTAYRVFMGTIRIVLALVVLRLRLGEDWNNLNSLNYTSMYNLKAASTLKISSRKRCSFSRVVYTSLYTQRSEKWSWLGSGSTRRPRIFFWAEFPVRLKLWFEFEAGRWRRKKWSTDRYCRNSLYILWTFRLWGLISSYNVDRIRSIIGIYRYIYRYIPCLRRRTSHVLRFWGYVCT